MTLQSIVTGAPLASHLTFSLPTFSSSTAVPVSFRLVETWRRIASAALCYLLSSTWGILEALAQHSCTNLLGTPTSAASLMGSFSRPAKHSTKGRRHRWINSKVYSIWLLRRFWGQDWASNDPIRNQAAEYCRINSHLRAEWCHSRHGLQAQMNFPNSLTLSNYVSCCLAMLYIRHIHTSFDKYLLYVRCCFKDGILNTNMAPALPEAYIVFKSLYSTCWLPQ